MLQDYVALVDDAELRISLAQKHKCHDIIINVRLRISDLIVFKYFKPIRTALSPPCLCLRTNQTYRDTKDRQLLLGYRGKVERGSVEERKINELLNNPVRRRRRRGRLRHHVT